MPSSSALTLTSGILDLAGNNLDIGTSSSFSNTGTLRLQGGETVSNLTNDTDSGTVTYNGGGSYSDLTVGDNYYHLTFDGTGTWTLDAALDANGDFTIANGTFDTSGTDYAVDIAGDVSITGGNFTANGSTITAAGSFSISDVVGLFTAGTSTVDLIGTGNLENNNKNNAFYTVNIAATTKTTTLIDSTASRFISIGTGTLSGTNKFLDVGFGAAANDQVIINSGFTLDGGSKIRIRVNGGVSVKIDGGDYQGRLSYQDNNSQVTLTTRDIALEDFDMRKDGAAFDLNGFNMTLTGRFKMDKSSTFNCGTGIVDINSNFNDSVSLAGTTAI